MAVVCGHQGLVGEDAIALLDEPADLVCRPLHAFNIFLGCDVAVLVSRKLCSDLDAIMPGAAFDEKRFLGINTQRLYDCSSGYSAPATRISSVSFVGLT